VKQGENVCRALQWAEEIGHLHFEKGQFCTCSCVILYLYLCVKLNHWFCVFCSTEEFISLLLALVGLGNSQPLLPQASGCFSLRR